MKIYTKSGEESTIFTSLLANGDGNAKELPNEVYEIYDGLGRGTKTVKTYFATVEADTQVTVELPKVKSVKVKPKIDFTFENGVFTFESKQNFNFCIQPDGDIFGCLHVFCVKDKKYEQRKNVIAFTKGEYTAENSRFININEYGVPVISPKSDTVIYIGKDAKVNAAIELNNVENVKICGNGVLSLIERCHNFENNFEGENFGAFRNNAPPSIYIRNNSKSIEIEDVVLNCEFRGITIRNSKDIKIKNVKMFTSTENADGINCINTSNLLVDGCYIQSADDCFCMYNSCDSIPFLADSECKNPEFICKNIEVKNCIMSSNARPFVLGGHANANENCIIENIDIHDCKIIETPYSIYNNPYEYSLYWSGFFRILSQSNQLVRNISFKNIIVDVTKGHNGKPVHIEVRGNKNASYTESKGFKIENITFENIVIQQNAEKIIKSLIKCSDEENCEIDGIKFNKFIINNKEIVEEDIMIEGNTKNIRIPLL